MRFKMDNKGIDSYTEALKKRVKYINETLANEIKNELQLYSPKRTGKLASSYKLINLDNAVQIINDCGYCKYVNYGTSFQSGQHFIELSIDDAKQSFNKIVEDSQKIH